MDIRLYTLLLGLALLGCALLADEGGAAARLDAVREVLRPQGPAGARQ